MINPVSTTMIKVIHSLLRAKYDLLFSGSILICFKYLNLQILNHTAVLPTWVIFNPAPWQPLFTVVLQYITVDTIYCIVPPGPLTFAI